MQIEILKRIQKRFMILNDSTHTHTQILILLHIYAI